MLGFCNLFCWARAMVRSAKHSSTNQSKCPYSTNTKAGSRHSPLKSSPHTNTYMPVSRERSTIIWIHALFRNSLARITHQKRLLYALCPDKIMAMERLYQSKHPIIKSKSRGAVTIEKNTPPDPLPSPTQQERKSYLGKIFLDL